MRYQDRIVVDPEILAGKPVVKGTRIPACLQQAGEAGLEATGSRLRYDQPTLFATLTEDERLRW